jgi:hypothetical protein
MMLSCADPVAMPPSGKAVPLYIDQSYEVVLRRICGNATTRQCFTPYTDQSYGVRGRSSNVYATSRQCYTPLAQWACPTEPPIHVLLTGLNIRGISVRITTSELPY